LRPAQSVEHFYEFVGRLFGKNDGARDVGFVAFDLRSTVDQNNITRFQRLRLDRSVRQRSRCADQHQGAALQVHFREAFFDPTTDVVLRHALFQ